MPTKPQGTGAALAKARQMVAEARLADPDEHFPYKLAEVRSLLADNPPMGPNGPSDDRVTVADFMSVRIAEATEAYVTAQAAYLTDSSPANREILDETKEELQAARSAHRRYRRDADGRPVANIVGESGAAGLDHLRGPRFRRAGEE